MDKLTKQDIQSSIKSYENNTISPKKFIEWCDYQNNDGELVFNHAPTNIEINYLCKALHNKFESMDANYPQNLERSLHYICNNNHTVIWDVRLPIETARFIIELLDGITLNCNIEFMDMLMDDIFAIMIAGYSLYYANDIFNIIMIKKISGGRLYWDVPVYNSVGDFYRWIDKKMRVLKFGSDPNDINISIYPNMYHQDNKIYGSEVRSFVYNCAANISDKKKRLAFINKYETNNMSIVDLYGDNYLYSEIIYNGYIILDGSDSDRSDYLDPDTYCDI